MEGMHSKEIVFLIPNHMNSIPFTTSAVIAEYAGVQHHTVTRLIRDNRSDFEEFGLLGFEIHKPNSGGCGGRPSKIYCLNEQQATLLITYLQNTEKVRAFKKEFVRQFYTMREELFRRRMDASALRPVRRTMTDAIREAESGDKWAYKKYANLAYKSAIGKNAAQLRQERGAAADAVASEYMSHAELLAVAKKAEADRDTAGTRPRLPRHHGDAAARHRPACRKNGRITV